MKSMSNRCGTIEENPDWFQTPIAKGEKVLRIGTYFLDASLELC